MRKENEKYEDDFEREEAKLLQSNLEPTWAQSSALLNGILPSRPPYGTISLVFHVIISGPQVDASCILNSHTCNYVT
jgi:hypothetical protein